MQHLVKRCSTFFLSFIVFSNFVFAQDDFGKGIGIQVAIPVQNATFSGEDFGEVNMGRQGFYVQMSRQSYIGRNNLGFHSYKTIGLAPNDEHQLQQTLILFCPTRNIHPSLPGGDHRYLLQTMFC